LDPDAPQSYLNRELSWLEFNWRVLAEAERPGLPVYEALKFLAIAAANLDEFFMVRVAGLHRQVRLGLRSASPDGLTLEQNLQGIRSGALAMLRDMHRVLGGILDKSAGVGLVLSHPDQLSADQRAQLRARYLEEIQPVLTPLAVDPSHPFPYISNLSLNLAVVLDGQGDQPEFARVKIPVGPLDRLFRLPGGACLWLEEVIALHLSELFRGRRVLGSYPFRVTRNTDYEFDEDEAEDLLATVEDGLRRRRFGPVVRLEVDTSMPEDVLADLIEWLEVGSQEVFVLPAPLGLADLLAEAAKPAGPGAHDPSYLPEQVDLEGEEGVFATLQDHDVLLHHPYQSFEAVMGFLQSAAEDPDVLAIKQTLYRTGNDPRILNTLIRAAEAGKQVVALVELKARFDELRNISWARMLEQAGVHVVYGLPGLKTHAKILLVVRREAGGLRRYVHVGTGNYNPVTAGIYTDVALLTADPLIGQDASALFNHLTGYARVRYRRLVVAPEALRGYLTELIGREADQARSGLPARILAKMNSLTDPALIAQLYRAARCGVRVQLIVRGVCCLRPGVPGLSETIEVHSLLGRFLEHARIWAFGVGRRTRVYLSSADWMTRNLDRRFELALQVRDPGVRRELLGILDLQWRDQAGSWVLLGDGHYRRVGQDGLSAQLELMRRHGTLQP
jgi:polyphosphate kinase